MASCGKDFLKIKDPNAMAPSNFPTTLDALNLELTNIYAAQHPTGLFGHDMLGKNIYCFDHTEDMAWQGTQFWIEECQNDTRASSDFISETWRDCWRGVQTCNTFFSDLARFKEKYAQASDEDELDAMEGQAHFLRAWFYYYLIGFWGETFIHDGQGGDKLGVPIIDSVAQDISQTRVDRSTVSEVWDFMINDLLVAESLLDNKSWDANNKARVDKWATKGFLGKAYVFTEQWDKATAILKDVIDNSGKSLPPFDIFKNMFNGENEFNSGSLFELNMKMDVRREGTGSSIGMVIAPCYINDAGSSEGSGWSNVFVHDKNLKRFGFDLPLYTMVKNPDYDASKPAGLDNLKTICDPAYVAESEDLRDKKEVDPRLWVGALQPFVDSMYANGRLRPIDHYKDVPASYYAWSLRKYVSLNGTEYSINTSNPANFYWLRLADIYLLYAEAKMETGDDKTALEYINKVKRRAYGLPVDQPSSIDYKSLSDKTMASDEVLSHDPLKYERYAEFFGEGSWWFDVCRWKIGSKEAAYYKQVRGGAINWDDKVDYAQPIPTSEIETNPSIGQNPGY
jgi:hypothetical protein